MGDADEMKRLRRIEDAAGKFEAKVLEAIVSDAWGRVFGIASIHGFDYDGPEFSVELSDLSKALGRESSLDTR